MDTHDAVELIGPALPDRGGTWADIGAGDGTFTRALAELLGPEARIYAMDRDPRAVAALRRWAERAEVNVIPVEGDFTGTLELPALDGILLANALHFVRDADAVLARLVTFLRPGGRVVIVEYDRRAASRWVPYPISVDRLPALASVAGLSPLGIVATRPSAYGGVLYVAAAERLSRR